MEQDVLISVIVPVYNVEAYLARCVDSILAQTYRNLEIILVDDGARDSSGAICDAFAEKDSRVRVIHKENGGLSSARNAGIDVAKGTYIAFVDSDDWIEPDAYEHMLDRLRRYGAKLACAGRYDVNGATGEKKVGLCPEKEECIPAEEMAGRIFLWDHCDSSACDKLYHRSLFEEYRYPLGKVCEDVPVTYKLALKAGQVVMCDKPIYNYFHRPGSITTASVSEKTFHFSQHTEVIYDYIRRNHPKIEKEARYLRVRSLVYNVQSLDLAAPELRRTYAQQYRRSQADLRAQLGFILMSPFFTKQEKAANFLMAFGLYRKLRELYHRIKRR